MFPKAVTNSVKSNIFTFSFQIFTDGITNQLLGCFNCQNEGDVVLVRVYGCNTDLLIDREAETKNIKFLHSVGLGPTLYATFENGLVYEYLPGEVLTPKTCCSEEIYPLVARKMAALHSACSEDFIQEPSLWATLKKFLSLIPQTFTNKEKHKR